jgi:hypothetical protein
MTPSTTQSNTLTRRRFLTFPLLAAGVAALAPLATHAVELVAPDPPAVLEPAAPVVPDGVALFELTPSRRLTDDEWGCLRDHAARMAEAGREGRHGDNAFLLGDRTLILQAAAARPPRLAGIMARVTAGGVRMMFPDAPPLTMTATPLNERARRGARGEEGKL